MADDIYYPELADGVRYFKEAGGRESMCELVEEYAKKYAADRDAKIEDLEAKNENLEAENLRLREELEKLKR